MLSSNQILSISGSIHDPKEIENALNIALNMSDPHKKQRKEDKIIFQIVGDKFCIGDYYDKVPEGWQKFQFQYDSDIVSRIIRQFFEKKEIAYCEYAGCDGSFEKGFLMKCFSYEEFNNDDIKSPDYGIVYFEPFTCFYAK